MRNANGWMLFEIIICLMIFAFMLTLSVKFSTISSQAFVAIEIKKLHAFVLFLKSKAILENKNIELVFNLKEKSYAALIYKYKLSKDVDFGFINDVKGPPSNPVALINNSITFKNNKIIFYQDGTISSGTIYLTDNSKTCLYALTCGVGQYIYVRIYKYNNKWCPI